MAGIMWAVGRRSAAGLLSRSALPGSPQTQVAAPRRAKNVPLSGRRHLRAGTAAACGPSLAVSTRGPPPGRAPAQGDRARRRRSAHARTPLPPGALGGG